MIKISGLGMGNGRDFGDNNALQETQGGGIRAACIFAQTSISKLFCLSEMNRCRTVIAADYPSISLYRRLIDSCD